MKLYCVPNVLMHGVPNSAVVAPDKSIVYISYGQISVLRPHNDGELIMLDTKQRILSIDCDYEWSDTEYLACATEDRHIWLWNVKVQAVVAGHTAHCDTKEKDAPLPLCFTPDKKVISADKKSLVVYDVLQNTYKSNNEIVRKHVITVFKVSPYNHDLIAAGTQAGLVIIISLQTMESYFTLRGHDQAIWSLDWIKAPAKIMLAPADADDDDDLFDIYTYDDIENEFGGLKDKPAPDSDDEREATEAAAHSFQDPSSSGHDNDFDFVEACETLKKEILGETTSCEVASGVDTNPNREECLRTTAQDDTETLSGSNASLSSRSSLGSGKSQNGGAESSKKRQSAKQIIALQDRFLLVTGSSESHITVWDTKTGRSIEKINLPGGRSAAGGGGGQKQQFASKNIVVRWLNHTKLLTNDPNGFIVLWDIEQHNEGFIFHKSKTQYPQRAIADIAVNRITEDFWVFSVHQQITCLNLDLNAPRYDYSTLQPRNQAITLNNLDPNVIAVGSARRVSLINLSRLSSINASFGSMTQKVQSQVLSLAFHPKKENLLAFSTREGRVGIFDTNRCANAPILMKPYFGKDVYSVTWVQQNGSENDYNLFCCGQGKLVYFPQFGPKKHVAIEMPEFKSVTNVGASEEFLSVGTHDGNVTVCELATNFKKIFNEKVSSRFISSFSWNGKLCAIASFENSIFVYDFSDHDNVLKSVLTGHEGPGTYVSWHPFKQNLLVSSSYDATVRIWDTEALSCLATAVFEREMFIAIFHPGLDDTVIAGGLESMLTIFNYKDQEINFKPKINSKQNKPPLIDLKMAKPSDDSVQKKARRERRKNNRAVDVKPVDENTTSTSDVVEVEKKLQEVNLSNEGAVGGAEIESTTSKPKKEKPVKDKLEYNYTTIFCLSMRELNRDPVAVLNKMLKDRKEDKKETRYARLISLDDRLVETVIEEELQNHKTSNTNSVGHVIFPSLTCNWKQMILDKAEKKSLTEEDLALAPNVCEEFWRDCCRLFALQCVENGEILRSIPYFLTVDDNEIAVEVLCKHHFYLEAVAVARMRIHDNHPINDKIIDDWTKYLISCGNFEAAAIVWVAAENYEDADNVLSRRQNPKSELQEIIEQLKELHKVHGSKKTSVEMEIKGPDIELPTKIIVPRMSKVFPDLPFEGFEDIDWMVCFSDESDITFSSDDDESVPYFPEN